MRETNPTKVIHCGYREVALRPAIYTMLFIMAIVAAPLGWLNYRIDTEGFLIADTAPYWDLVTGVETDLAMVRRMLADEHIDESELKGAVRPVVATPEIAPTNVLKVVTQKNKKLKIKLTAIYWSPRDPIATINGKTYHTGELLQGCRIVEIRKTEVVFKDKKGEKIVKKFYAYLDEPKDGMGK